MCRVAEQVLYKCQTKILSFASVIGSVLPPESSFWAAAARSVPWPSEQDLAPEKEQKTL